MASPVLPTFAGLKQAAYDLFDEGEQQFITDAEMGRYINAGARRLYRWLVSEGEDYLWSEDIGGFADGTTDFALPADFAKLLKVKLLPGYRPVRRLSLEEWRGAGGCSPFGYILMGNFLRFGGIIDPTAQISLMYVPTYSDMVLDTDTWNFPYIPGWEDFIVHHAAIKARIKEESDVTDLRLELADIRAEIQTDMINRDMGRFRHVIDVERR